MTTLRNIWADLVEKRLWPVAVLLAAGLLAVPVVLAKGGEWVAQPEVMSAETHSVEGIELPVQSKESLIAYKKILGRDTDLIDIEQIS